MRSHMSRAKDGSKGPGMLVECAGRTCSGDGSGQAGPNAGLGGQGGGRSWPRWSADCPAADRLSCCDLTELSG